MNHRNRGQKKPKLRDLSRQAPTHQEVDELVEKISDEEQHPVVAAITGAALLDYEVEKRIREKFRRLSDDEWETMTGRDGPFATFSARIQAGYALGIYNTAIRDGLDTVRAIRNQFAHARRPITFDNELIGKELSGITLPKKTRSKLYRDLKSLKDLDEEPEGSASPNQMRFIGLCLVLSLHMRLDETRRLRAQIRHLRKRNKLLAAKRDSLILAGLGRLSPTQEYFGQSSQLGQTANPSLEAPSQLPLTNFLQTLAKGEK